MGHFLININIYCDETYTKYLILSFYEGAEKKTPVLVIQIEKFLGDDSKENWLKYLGILKDAETENKNCTSGFCCTKCGKDLTITDERFSEIFPNVTKNKTEFINALNVSLKAEGFEYNSCDRQAKIFAQIKIETNGLTATTEGKGTTWKLIGKNKLLDYFKATLGAKQRWFNQDFWDTKLYKKFSMVGYYEKIENDSISNELKMSPTDTAEYYGMYNGSIQSKYHVKIPMSFVNDTAGEYIKYNTPTASEKLQIEKNIFNYAYGNSLGNGDYLTTNDGYNYRGRGAIQLTGKDGYISLNSKLKKAPYNMNVDIVVNPNFVAEMPSLTRYSAFIHFKGQLKNISKLDILTIDKVSALINTGNENGTANHAKERAQVYNKLILNQFKCKHE